MKSKPKKKRSAKRNHPVEQSISKRVTKAEWYIIAALLFAAIISVVCVLVFKGDLASFNAYWANQ